MLKRVQSEGAVFQAGDLLATLELPPGVVVTKATLYEGAFPHSSSFSSSKDHSGSQHATVPDGVRRHKLLKQEQQRDEHKRIQRLLNPLPTYRACRDQLYNALHGYQLRQEDENEAVARFFECTLNPMLPICEVKEVLAVIGKQRISGGSLLSHTPERFGIWPCSCRGLHEVCEVCLCHYATFPTLRHVRYQVHTRYTWMTG